MSSSWPNIAVASDSITSLSDNQIKTLDRENKVTFQKHPESHALAATLDIHHSQDADGPVQYQLFTIAPSISPGSGLLWCLILNDW